MLSGAKSAGNPPERSQLVGLSLQGRHPLARDLMSDEQHADADGQGTGGDRRQGEVTEQPVPEFHATAL